MGSQFSKTAIIILPPKSHICLIIYHCFPDIRQIFPDIFYPNTIAFIFILRHINFIKNGKQLQRGCCMSKNTILTGGICFLLVFLLLHPAESLSCARAGMTLWLNTLIPTLLPFIILTGMLTHTGHIRKTSPAILNHSFHIFSGVVSIWGWLCFSFSECCVVILWEPKLASDLYGLHKISKKRSSLSHHLLQ